MPVVLDSEPGLTIRMEILFNWADIPTGQNVLIQRPALTKFPKKLPSVLVKIKHMYRKQYSLALNTEKHSQVSRVIWVKSTASIISRTVKAKRKEEENGFTSGMKQTFPSQTFIPPLDYSYWVEVCESHLARKYIGPRDQRWKLVAPHVLAGFCDLATSWVVLCKCLSWRSLIELGEPGAKMKRFLIKGKHFASWAGSTFCQVNGCCISPRLMIDEKLRLTRSGDWWLSTCIQGQATGYNTTEPHLDII